MTHEAKTDFFEKLRLLGIIPVVKIEDARHAVPLARALKEGGLLAAEITFRTTAAEESIRQISHQVPDMLLGAGTVLSATQVEQAAAAGAKFIVSPGLNEGVVSRCRELNLPVIPGVATATEIQQALNLGLSVLKFFPAEASGGLSTLKALAAPFNQVQFIPTGGVNVTNMLDYLKSRFVLAVGGSWMVKSDLIAQEHFETIRQLAQEAVRNLLGLRLQRVSFAVQKDNASGEQATAPVFPNEAFLPIQINGSTNQIVVQTNFLDRAEFYFKQWGLTVSRKAGLVRLQAPGVDIVLEEGSSETRKNR